MTQKKIQLLGISNAIVDVLAHVDDDFLSRIETPKHSMTLIDEERAKYVYGQMAPTTEMSGGSVANTIASFASLGGRAGYIGRVADDQFGHVFNHDMESLGVDVRLAPVGGGLPTAVCNVLITPDGERTLQTFLGACMELSADDINVDSIGSPELLLLEAYIWDTSNGREVVEKVINIARRKGYKVSLSLSDAQCVDRHRAAFMKMLMEEIEIVFSNETEIMSLLEVDSFEAVLEVLVEFDDTLFVLTRSAKGSVIVKGNEQIIQNADTIDEIIDATGAGDVYTAGFLYEWLSKKSLKECAKKATKCASKVIQQVGARIV